MRALLEREIYMFSMNRKIISSICLLIMVIMDNDIVIVSNTVGTAVRCILLSWLCLEPPLTCINSENKNKGDCYLAALPFNRTQLTLVKYLYPLFIMFVVVVFGSVGYCIGNRFLSLSTILFVIPIVSLLLFFPIYYWLGGVKGARICTLAVIFSAIIVSAVFSLLLDHIKSAFIFSKGFPMLLVMLALLCVSSFFLSVHLYKKRDI